MTRTIPGRYVARRNVINALMVERHITAIQLSNNAGVHVSTVRNICNGARATMTHAVARKLAASLGVPIDVIAG